MYNVPFSTVPHPYNVPLVGKKKSILLMCGWLACQDSQFENFHHFYLFNWINRMLEKWWLRIEQRSLLIWAHVWVRDLLKVRIVQWENVDFSIPLVNSITLMGLLSRYCAISTAGQVFADDDNVGHVGTFDSSDVCLTLTHFGNNEVWMAPLSEGRYGVVLFNRSPWPQSITAEWLVTPTCVWRVNKCICQQNIFAKLHYCTNVHAVECPF